MMLLSDLLPDPFSPAFTASSNTWGASMVNTSRDLFLFLFFLELIVLGVQALYFKDSVFEYIKMFAGKVLVGSFVILTLANANTIFPEVVSLIAGTGNSVATGAVPVTTAACESHQRWSCVPPSSGSTVEGIFVGWAIAYFTAADLSRVGDSALSVATGILIGTPFPPDPGNGPAGLPMAFIMGHGQFQLVCFALGMMCIMSAGTVYFTYVLLTFETQIVLAIGVFTLAGYGWRFTQQFATAFPKYCVTIGAKFFAYYFVVAIVQGLLSNVSIGGMLAGLIGGAMVPFGFGAVILLLSTSSAPIVAIISGILIVAIPQIAGSLTSGGSALSAMGGLGQIAGGFKSAAKNV